MKKSVVIILLIALVHISCKDKDPTEPIDPNILRVAGKYVATTFILPGNDNGPVDVLMNGGSITADLSTSLTAKGRVIIPRHPNLRGDDFDEGFDAIFTLKNDSLQFKNTENLLSNPQLFFVLRENNLEAIMEGISQTIIVLTKED